VPALLILKPGNVATPLAAFAVAVPDKVPLPGFVPIARVTAFVAAVTTFPCASSMLTCTDGVIAAPATTLLGCTVNTSCVAAPAVTLNALLVADVSPPALAVSVYPAPTLLILRLENVATPPTAVTGVVPDSVPPPAFVPMAMVTEFAAETTFPSASSMLTCTAGVIDDPAPTLLGCAVNTSCVAAPAVTLNALLVAPVRAPELAFNV
jgi:hypothetical protein